MATNFVMCSWHVDHIISHFFTELKIYHHSLFITYITISTLPTPAGRKTHVANQPCIWPNSPRVLRSSVVRASIPVGDSYFSLSRVSARDMLITSCLISSPSLKITIIFYLSHTWRFRLCTDPRKTQDACHTWTLYMAQLGTSPS